MSNAREVITVQVGHYANFIGAHFWNGQDLSLADFDAKANEINYDVMYREGVAELNGRQVTYTPRLVSIDLKGALGSLPLYGDLYNEVAAQSKTDLLSSHRNWHHGVDVQREEGRQKSSFLKELEEDDAKIAEIGRNRGDEDKDKDTAGDLDSSVTSSSLESEVRLWSDYLRARFHPKTNVVVNEYQHGNPNQPFDIFGLGQQVFGYGNSILSDDIEDRIHFFAEEADSLKAFHLLADGFDGFGGLSVALADFLKDDYGSQCIMAFPALPTRYGDVTALKATQVMLNTALTIRGLSQTSTLVTPMSLNEDTFPLQRKSGHRNFNDLKYNPDLNYHTSAILSTALDTATLAWRMLHGPYTSPHEVAAGLNYGGKVVAVLGLNFPFCAGNNGKTLAQFLSKTGNPIIDGTVSLMPNCNIVSSDDVWCRSVSSRICSTTTTSIDPKLDILAHFDRITTTPCPTSVTLSRSPCRVGRPYPTAILDPTLETASSLTMWQSSGNIEHFVKSLVDRVTRVNLHKLHRFEEAGLEQDELTCTLEDLTVLSECYGKSSDMI